MENGTIVFESMGVLHLKLLLGLCVFTFVLVYFGVYFRGTRRQKVFHAFWAAFSLFSLLASIAYSYVTEGLKHAVPLQVCDLGWFASFAVFAFPWRTRFYRSLLYFWGLTLCLSALLVPDLSGVSYWRFLQFWTCHYVFFASAVYVSFGLGFAPEWKDYRRVVIVSAGVLTTIFLYNWAFGTNMMYLNAKPAVASPMDALGPWPIYVFVEFGIACTMWAAMTWLAERRHRGVHHT
jgi:hypothetical integral membrane protein (TIGR02206 family)